MILRPRPVLRTTSLLHAIKLYIQTVTVARKLVNYITLLKDRKYIFGVLVVGHRYLVVKQHVVPK